MAAAQPGAGEVAEALVRPGTEVGEVLRREVPGCLRVEVGRDILLETDLVFKAGRVVLCGARTPTAGSECCADREGGHPEFSHFRWAAPDR